MTASEPLTWSCHVCHEERPDAAIAVLSRPGVLANGLYVRQNVRYCRDRTTCIEGAKGLDWVPKGLRFLDYAVVTAFPDEEAQRSLVHMVPAHLHDGIARYVSEGRPTGDFLHAVFENDLGAAAERADIINRPRLAQIALFVRWHCPPLCHGSVEIVQRWLDMWAARRAAENG